MRGLYRRLVGETGNFLTPAQRATHTYVIGQPGTGKSRALESWVMQDITAGHGVGVIDPHGDLFRNLLLRISSKPDIWKKVIIVDPCSSKWTVGFNPLEAVKGLSQERLALFLTDVMVKIWKLNPTTSPRMIWLLTNSFVALSGLGLSLLDLPRFLLDKGLRERHLSRLPHERVHDYFRLEFPRSQGAIHQWVTPVLNKIGGLIFDPDIRLMLAARPSLNFREILDRKYVFLMNLPKGMIGEGTSALLGAFVVAHFQKAALSRADTRKREPYYLYLDEFQNYTTDNIKDVLSESRKYALSLILAHQYLDQLSADLRSAVLNTSGTIISFRVGYQDAYRLAREIFPSPSYLSNSATELRPVRSGVVSRLIIQVRNKRLGWEGLAQVLSELRHREFWSRRRGSHRPIKARTLEMPDPILTPELKVRMHKLIEASGRRFGRPRRDVQREFAWRRHKPSAHVSGLGSGVGDRPDDGDTPFWGD